MGRAAQNQAVTLLLVVSFAAQGQGTSARSRLIEPVRSKTISKPQLPFVDAPPLWGEGGRGEGQGSGGRSGDGNGSGSGAGPGAGAGNRTEFTQPGAGSGDSGGDSGDESGGGEGELFEEETPGGSGIVTHPLFYPMCLFVDEMYPSSQISSEIKQMVDASAACGVTLVVFPFTLKGGYPESPDVINNAQQTMCNLPQAGIAPAASTSACVSHSQSADKMCVSDPLPPDYQGNVAGCAQLQSAGGVGYTYKNDAEREKFENGEHGGGGQAAGGMAAPSIEDAGQCTASIIAHEAQGHSQIGHPNGEGSGFGIKGMGNGDAGGWTGYGCSMIRANSFGNDGRWTYDPSRTTYYVKPNNPEAFKDIMSPKPIFGPAREVATSSAPRDLETPRGTTIDVVDTPKGQETVDAPAQAPGQSTAMEDTPDSVRHRRQGMASALLARLKEAMGVEEVADGPGENLEPARARPAPPEPGEPMKAGPSIGFDDSAPKGQRAGGGGSTVTSVEPPPAGFATGGDSGFSSSSFSEGTSAGAAGAASALGRTLEQPGRSGTGAGSSLAFDDNAPKGGYPAAGASNRSSREPASEGGPGAINPVIGSAGFFGGLDSRGSGTIFGDDSFFDEVGDADEEEDGRKQRGRRSPRSSLRGKGTRTPASRSQTGLRGSSGVSRESVGRKARAGSQ